MAMLVVPPYLISKKDKINNPPVAVPDQAILAGGSGGVNIQPLRNDMEWDEVDLESGVALTLVIVDAPMYGSALVIDGFKIRYSARMRDLESTITDTMKYRTCDSRGGCVTSLITVVLTPENVRFGTWNFVEVLTPNLSYFDDWSLETKLNAQSLLLLGTLNNSALSVEFNSDEEAEDATTVTTNTNSGTVKLNIDDSSFEGSVQLLVNICGDSDESECTKSTIDVVRPTTICARTDDECEKKKGENRDKDGIINDKTCQCVYSCGNDVIDEGEECDGGPCCTRLCKHIVQGETCRGLENLDLCAQSVCGAVGANECVVKITDCEPKDGCTEGRCFSATGECIFTPLCNDNNLCTDDSCSLDKNGNGQCKFKENEKCENCIKQRSCKDCSNEGCSWLQCNADGNLGAGNLTVAGKTISLFRNTLVTETFLDVSAVIADGSFDNISDVILNVNSSSINTILGEGNVNYTIVNNSTNPNSTIASIVITEEVLNACFASSVENEVNTSGILNECNVKTNCDSGGGDNADNQLDSRLGSIAGAAAAAGAGGGGFFCALGGAAALLFYRRKKPPVMDVMEDNDDDWTAMQANPMHDAVQANEGVEENEMYSAGLNDAEMDAVFDYE
eukprot:TRINITY_DN2068_c1_g1_i2.p1 TRINITY_DN2068_c1_g1~~TRINITY_DN2068_c1_g1_i2.p1  ORF type:complete len:693 (+),score=172.13 TRINITY_DN2068_c1_g1_i2:217-2079(+)